MKQYRIYGMNKEMVIYRPLNVEKMQLVQNVIHADLFDEADLEELIEFVHNLNERNEQFKFEIRLV